MALICWSGGLDSTLALFQLAKLFGDGMGPDKHGLRALSIDHPQVACQPQAAGARAALKRKFKELGLTFQHATVSFRSAGQFYAKEVPTRQTQAQFWLAVAVAYLEEDEDLTMGYIYGDGIWHYAEHLQAAFRGLQGISGRTGKLNLPLEWTYKAKVIDQLKAVGLYEHCWYCEGTPAQLKNLGKGQKGPCGKCPGCRAHHTALWQLKQKFYPDLLKRRQDVMKSASRKGSIT